MYDNFFSDMHSVSAGKMILFEILERKNIQVTKFSVIPWKLREAN